MPTALPDAAQVLVAGASRGIGLGFVRGLLAQPKVARVFAACRDPQRAAALQKLADEQRERLSLLTIDVGDENSIAAAAQATQLLTPRLHLLINTIGLLHDAQGLKPERKLADVNLADLQRGFTVNAFAPILIAKHFTGLLIHDQRAVFVSLSARVGSIGDNRLGGWYGYRAGKAAQNQLVHTLAVEMARRAPNLVCALLHPGTVDTDLSKPFQSAVAREKLFNVDRACEQLLQVIDGLNREHSGGFFGWDGAAIPW
jgi:NAD(P)-dependent dehydrogenase (short-subunit alcohol dehydrogenase family)